MEKVDFHLIPTGLHVAIVRSCAGEEQTMGEAMESSTSAKQVVMARNATWRRNFLKAGMFAVLPRAANALAWGRQGPAVAAGTQGQLTKAKEGLIRAYYSGWEKKQWNTIESLLADNFTFTSPNNDDHIDKRAFRERCWPGAGLIGTIEMECVMVRGDEGFAKYLLTTTDGKSLRNTEFFEFTGGKVKTIEVYFGGKRGYPGQQV